MNVAGGQLGTGRDGGTADGAGREVLGEVELRWHAARGMLEWVEPHSGKARQFVQVLAEPGGGSCPNA